MTVCFSPWLWVKLQILGRPLWSRWCWHGSSSGRNSGAFPEPAPPEEPGGASRSPRLPWHFQTLLKNSSSIPGKIVSEQGFGGGFSPCPTSPAAAFPPCSAPFSWGSTFVCGGLEETSGRWVPSSRGSSRGGRCCFLFVFLQNSWVGNRSCGHGSICCFS